MALKASKRMRLLQFVESLNASSASYYDLPPTTKRKVEDLFPGIGSYLRNISDQVTNGICQALEEERLRAERKRGAGY